MKKKHIIWTVVIAIAGTGIALAGLLISKIPPPVAPRSTAIEIDKKASKVKRKKVKGNQNAQQLIEEGDIYKSNDDLDGALQNYQAASQKAPNDVLPYIKIGEVLFLQKNYAGAHDNFSFAATRVPDNPTILFQRAKSLLGLRKIIDAKAALEKIAPENEELRYYKALISAFFNEQQAREIIPVLAKDAANETIKKNAAIINQAYVRFDIAKDAPLTYLQTLLANAFNSAGEYGLAIELSFDVIKKEADYRDAWLILGHSFLNENMWNDASDAFSRALELDSSSNQAHFYRGVARRKLNKPAEAASDFADAIKMGWRPKVIAQEQIAETLFELGEFEKAFIFYREIVLTDSSDVKRFVRPIALAINHLKKFADALSLAEKALAANPQNALAESLYGWTLLVNEDLAGAREHIEKALKINPQLAAGHLNKGMLEEKRWAVPEAISSYGRAIEFAKQQKETAIEQTAREKYEILNGEGFKNANATNGAIPVQPTNLPSLTL